MHYVAVHVIDRLLDSREVVDHELEVRVEVQDLSIDNADALLEV